jgi:polysaccharide chain length determinant protein (PEP-CTERM system associated)
MFEGSEELQRNLDGYYRLIVRRRWWLLLTTSGVFLGTVGLSFLLPNQYLSEATIIVEQQQVPERYVTPTSTADLSSALQAMTQDVLSRAHLLRIIDELELYKKERKRLVTEELLELMRRNIEIKPLEGDPQRRNVNSFRISFYADAPHMAQDVTSRLTTLFIEQNLKTREQQAIGTTEFLGSQLAVAREELQRQEKRLRDFKMEYLGELPEQQQGNLQILAGLHLELQNTVAALGRAQQQRIYLTSLLNQYRRLSPASREPSGASPESPIETVRRELNRLDNERAQMLSRYLPKHPDVLKIDQEIAQSKALLEQLENSEKPASGRPAEAAETPAATREQDTTIAQLRSQLEANQAEIENLRRDQKRLDGQIATYERRLNLTPVREQQVAAVLRDYNLSKQNYEDLLNKKTQSELASSLEHQQQGQQFRIVDPPSLPTKPASPSRIRISLGGLAGGLCLAICFAMFIEVRRASFYTEDELKRQFALPIILGIPPLPTPSELRTRSKRRALEWLGGSVLLLVVLVAEAYVVWRD